MTNEDLRTAQQGKNDEFYTQFHDIEVEMNAYIEYDADVFRGKTILLPCDDPEWSKKNGRRPRHGLEPRRCYFN